MAIGDLLVQGLRSQTAYDLTGKFFSVSLVILVLASTLQIEAHNTGKNNCSHHRESCSCQKFCQRQFRIVEKVAKPQTPSCHRPTQEQDTATSQSKTGYRGVTENLLSGISMRSECGSLDSLDFMFSIEDRYTSSKILDLSLSMDYKSVSPPPSEQMKMRTLPVLLPPPHV